MLWQSAKAFAAKREMESPIIFRVQNDNLNGENDDKPLGCGVPYYKHGNIRPAASSNIVYISHWHILDWNPCNQNVDSCKP